jgi:hypothetical protein
MKSLCLVLISLLFFGGAYPQVPILFYDFENNTNRNAFENIVEQTINTGNGPISRVGSGTIASGVGNNNTGTGLYSSSWQNITTDPGTAATEYYQMSVNTTGFKGISIKFRFMIPFSSGPGNFGVLISSNGTTYKKTGSFNTGGPNNMWSDVGFSFYNYPEVNNISSLSIRLYAYKGVNSGSGGYMAVDNLMITADTIVSNAGNITLLNESNIYSSYYSGGTGLTLTRANLIVNGPNTNVSLSSPLNISQNFIVSSGATVVCGNYPLWGAGSFTLNSGGTLSIGSPLGVSLSPDSSGNICSKGTRKYNSGANYIYNGAASQITGNGLPASLNCLTISNSNGVTLTNSLQLVDTLKLLSGKVFLGNQNLIIGDTAVVSGYSADSYVVTDNLGVMVYDNMARNVDIKFPIGTMESYNPAILNYSGTIDTFKASVKTVFDNPPVISNKVVNRQWIISENNSGGSVASLKLCWISGNEAPGFSVLSQVMIGRYDGSGWFEAPAVISGAGTLSDPYAASVSGVSQFFSFGVGNEGALPVELIAFYGEHDNADIFLHWSTATETNSNSFEIERKELSAKTWLKIGCVHANFLSNSPRTYSFTDRNPKPGYYQYRLKMVDNDGSYQYSKLVEMIAKLSFGLELLQNYPNPFNPSTRIDYKVPFDGNVLIEVFNALGSKVAQLVNEFKVAGYYYAEFNSSLGNVTIPSGAYYYKMTATDSKNGNKQNVIKKMMLLK